MWVSEASMARESSALEEGCWSGTAAARKHFAFWKASCALSVHYTFLAKKTAVEVHHAKKTLQFLDVLRGADDRLLESIPPPKCCGQEITKLERQKHFFPS
jgi:hypothetical protein